jgi:hypothetical protein
MINRMLEGLSPTQTRVVRVRFLFLCLKMATDFLTAAGTAFTASAIEARGMPTPLVIAVSIIGGLVVAAKNLGDAINAALPPPVITQVAQKEPTP